MTTHAAAVDALVSNAACTDAAVERLEELARYRGGAAVWNDLGAAYYVRAQRHDTPLDLLRASEATDQAVRLAPAMPEAKFNRALVAEALGLAGALKAWDDVRHTDRSPWSGEAAEHWRRLDRRILKHATREWRLNREHIPAVAATGDRRGLAQLVATHIAAAQRYVEEELLPAWAKAASDEEGRTHLRVAHAVAREIARESGDRYLLDAVTVIERSLGSPAAGLLREGHLAFAEARATEGRLNYIAAAAPYERAERALARAASPMRLGAQLGLAVASAFHSEQIPHASAILDDVERAARRQGYTNLLGRTQSNRGFVLFLGSRYAEALSAYDAALVTFRRIDDGENIANAHTREIGMYRMLGQKALAWRAAFHAQRYAAYQVVPRSRHHLLAEVAAAAVAAGYPRIAIHYQNEAIDLIQRDPVSDAQSIEEQRANLAIAFRGRAAIWLAFKPHEELDAARADLGEAIRLTKQQTASDENKRRALMARVAELQGLAAPCGEARIQPFTRALDLATRNEYRTFRAALFAERAEAQRCAGDNAAAERDLVSAIDELHAEERGILEHRIRGAGEPLWAGYFSRFQESYDRLIRLEIESDDTDKAFAYAEEARAFEPLNLLDPSVVPQAFRKLTGNGETLGVAQVQQHLPRGTFLVEFCVLDDLTFAWILSRDRSRLVPLHVRKDDIENWTKRLHRAAESHDGAAFTLGLEAPFSALLAEPLARIEAMPEGRSAGRRVVFIPDGPIHGLPFPALRSPRTHRYLVEDWTVSVASSATLYVFSRLRDQALAKLEPGTVLLVGDPAFKHEPLFPPNLERLPAAAHEIETIKKFYGAQAQLLPAEKATVPAFLNLARESTIIHFAGHALVNEEAPFRSMLVLAPAGRRSGALDAEELLTKLDVRKTRLFVLAACRSAGGAKGLAPLLRPIVTAGVPGVVGSLWEVESGPTEVLLVELHRHYRAGNDADRALRLAQIDLMKREDIFSSSPLAWAPFEAIGHASSPFAKTPQTRREQP